MGHYATFGNRLFNHLVGDDEYFVGNLTSHLRLSKMGNHYLHSLGHQWDHRAMLKNDEIFWVPTEASNAAYISWGGSEGDFAKLWEHHATRWKAIQHKLARVGVPAPSGRIIEFGSGMGLLDDLLDDSCSCLVMVDHCDAFIRERARPLSTRCRHVLWSAEGLARLQAESPSYDWFISLAVFWHVDDPTAAALIRELGKLLKPGGYVLIHGWNSATSEKVREMSTQHRLFDSYPTYVLNLDLLQETLEPDYQELSRETILLYRKKGIERRKGLSAMIPNFLRPTTGRFRRK
jgi:2-polyprenyl-3-methyl-5-hydroxy-6-metoxy-1,4-benzoquinol methylase